MFRIVISILIAMFIAIPAQQTSAGYALFATKRIAAEKNLVYTASVIPICNNLQSKYGLQDIIKLNEGQTIAILPNQNDREQVIFSMNDELLSAVDIQTKNEYLSKKIMNIVFETLKIPDSNIQNRTMKDDGFTFRTAHLWRDVDVQMSRENDGYFRIVIKMSPIDFVDDTATMPQPKFDGLG